MCGSVTVRDGQRAPGRGAAWERAVAWPRCWIMRGRGCAPVRAARRPMPRMCSLLQRRIGLRCQCRRLSDRGCASMLSARQSGLTWARAANCVALRGDKVWQQVLCCWWLALARLSIGTHNGTRANCCRVAHVHRGWLASKVVTRLNGMSTARAVRRWHVLARMTIGTQRPPGRTMIFALQHNGLLLIGGRTGTVHCLSHCMLLARSRAFTIEAQQGPR